MYAILSHQLHDELDSRLTQQLTRFEEAVTGATDEQSLIDLTRSYLAGNKANALRQNGFVLSLQTKTGFVVSSSDGLRPEDLAESKDLLETGRPFLTDATLSCWGVSRRRDRGEERYTDSRGRRNGGVAFRGELDPLQPVAVAGRRWRHRLRGGRPGFMVPAGTRPRAGSEDNPHRGGHLSGGPLQDGSPTAAARTRSESWPRPWTACSIVSRQRSRGRSSSSPTFRTSCAHRSPS